MMWQHHNEFLHNDGRTIHFQEIAAITQAIKDEHNLSQNGLPDQYQHLFWEKLNYLLSQDIHAKQTWLTSVWEERSS
jgi:hypothetical protein